MTETQKISWKRLSAEGAAIVVSILLAFGIDAWWDARNDLAEEREIQVGRDAEYVDLRARLDQWAQFNREGAVILEEYLSDSVIEMDLESARSTVGNSSWNLRNLTKSRNLSDLPR